MLPKAYHVYSSLCRTEYSTLCAHFLRAGLVREPLTVMFRNVSPSGHPNILLLRHVLHELPQTLRAAGLPGNS